MQFFPPKDEEAVNSVKFRKSEMAEYIINRDGSASMNMYFDGEWAPMGQTAPPTITYSANGMHVAYAEDSFYFYKDLSKTKITDFDDLVSCNSIFIVTNEGSIEYTKVVE